MSATPMLLSDPTYFEIVRFLDHEAALLDANEMLAWHELLSEDLVYQAPVRVARDRGTTQFDEHMFHFDEVYATITLKLQRMQLPSAWAENPPSGTRRFVTGVRAWEGDGDGEYRVASSILLVRTRPGEIEPSLLTAARDDVLRRAPSGFKLARRMIWLDQGVLGTHNLAVYL